MPEYIKSKTILSRLSGAPDPYFGIMYNMNLYRGCQHQCIYCDSRSRVYGLGDLAHIRIKQNALSLLERELRGKRRKGTVGTGSMNDPYMPVELRENLTRGALKVLSRYHFPVHALTKSDLVLRDTDIWQELSKVYAAVSFTITTPYDDLSRKIEPGAPVSSLRFKALESLARAGVYSGVILSPVLPFITDKEESIRLMVRKAVNAGASYIIAWMGMTQREGQREYFYSKLDQCFPGLRTRYAKTFGNDYQCSSPDARALHEVFHEECEKRGIPVHMQFYKKDHPTQLEIF